MMADFDKLLNDVLRIYFVNRYWGLIDFLKTQFQFWTKTLE